MANKILHKRNLSAGNDPTTASLEPGELAINVADGKLFLRQSGSIANKIITVGESSSYSATASFVTASGVFGPYGANSIISASYALQALSSSYANFATSASHTLFAETASNSLNAQDILIYVLNNSGYNIPKGTVVHITASGNSSDIPRIISASYENDANSANTLGIANESIANGANGYVMTEGVLKGVDTSNFQSGQLIYLGASGSIIGSAPQAPLHGVRLGQVVRVQSNNGSIYVRIDNGYELDELHDVRIMTASLQYGDLLMRSGSVWTNSKQLSGSYGITGTLSATHVTASDLYAGATYISGSLIVNGQSTFYGTASFINVTASNLFISESFISVNVFEPIERFGGLKVYDSGSSTATASLAWDSLHNHWVYQNVDGATYTGGMLLSGPRNTGSLGDEPNLTKWFVPRGDGGDHLNDSQIFTSASVTQITGSLTVTAGVTASFTGSYTGDGTGLYNIPASGIVGLNLSQIASGSVSASISPATGLQVNTNVTATSFTGSLQGTASFATSASFAVTASYIITAQTASYVLNAVSSSFATSSSRAITASFSNTASFITPLNQNVLITGSINITQNITGSRMFLSASSNMNSGSTLTVYGSGSTQPVFTVQGSSGELFSVTDSLSGSLFSVNDISGLPILEVFSDNTTLIGNYLDPMLITTAKVTQTNSGSFTVYALPTASYDTAFFEYSVKSGSNARAGTIMAIQSGSSVNFTETTTTDFGSTTAISFTVVVTGSNMALTGSSTTGSWTIKTIVRGL